MYITKPKFFYGYWIVIVAFFCLFIFGGLMFYAFSLFIKPLQTEFGWGRGEIMIAMTILFLVSGIASPYIGRMVDRYGARIITFIGVFTAGLGFASLSIMHNIWHFYISYIVIALGMVSIGPVPATAIVSNWFKERRGTALGITATGVGAGGLVLAPLIGGYLIPTFGWRAAYLALAVLVWALFIPLVLLIRTKPSDMGLYPDGIEVSQINAVNESPTSSPEELTLKMALTTPTFWLIGLSFLLITFAGNGIVQNQVPHLEDIGFPSAIAAATLGGIGFGSIAGKLFFGWLCDRMPAKYALRIALSLVLVSIVILMSIKLASPPAILWLYAIILGFCLGSVIPVMSMLVSNNFGLTSYGAIFGMLNLLQNIGTATGPLMAGYMYDARNTYHEAFVIFIILCAIALATSFVLGRPSSLIASK
ncbi:MFS transporter [Chloroflexota bacterium]